MCKPRRTKKSNLGDQLLDDVSDALVAVDGAARVAGAVTAATASADAAVGGAALTADPHCW